MRLTGLRSAAVCAATASHEAAGSGVQLVVFQWHQSSQHERGVFMAAGAYVSALDSVEICSIEDFGGGSVANQVRRITGMHRREQATQRLQVRL